jgi:hypothetical protein
VTVAASNKPTTGCGRVAVVANVTGLLLGHPGNVIGNWNNGIGNGLRRPPESGQGSMFQVLHKLPASQNHNVRKFRIWLEEICLPGRWQHVV